MNLVQKLPIGLGLACLMMLSSCSKDDVSAPQPQVEGVNESSGLRGGLSADPNVPPGGLYLAPVFPSTVGPVGIGVYPTYWERNVHVSPDNPDVLPTGTSSLTHLWGNQVMPWKKALPPVPGASNSSSIITVTSNGIAYSKSSSAKTKIINLKPDKKYEITYYVSTTVPNVFPGSLNYAYAEGVTVGLHHGNGGSYSYSFEGKNAEWIVQKYVFTPVYGKTEAIFEFNARANNGQFAYVNIFVDKNSIKELPN